MTLEYGQVTDLSDTRNPAGRRQLGTFKVAIPDSSVLLVDSTHDTVDADPGDGRVADSEGRSTLRAAVQQSNTTPGAITIVLPDGVYAFAIPGAEEDDCASGDLDVRDSLTIVGSGAHRSVLDGRSLDRIFDVHPGADAAGPRRHGNPWQGFLRWGNP